jgi:hypothetical protein
LNCSIRAPCCHSKTPLPDVQSRLYQAPWF